ncbi:acyltransferase family protein [Fructilactobacillus ixorae]|uniref:Acyltransferase family protein n=1 Tax=Fructilactobacillus ixorae TaxID=1750535 RepID=A0ABY5C7Y8_9LACO|nr:acyltransferase family protein [Fructilactobacillus ixorae]USS93475.1 acyltransferase family protein [Fructilactobacillus ixorae]
MKRIEWIDVTRGIGMLLIVIGHSLMNYTNSDFSKAVFAVNVPIFFVLSGYLFKVKPLGKVARGGLDNLLLPYIGTALIIVILSIIAVHFPHLKGLQSPGSGKQMLLAAGYGIGSPTTLNLGAFQLFIPAIGAIWFLLAMLIGNLLFNGIVRLAELTRYSMILTLVLSMITALLGFTTAKALILPWSINAALISPIFYWFGYALRHYDLVENGTSYYFIVGIVLWVISTCAGFFFMNVAFATNPLLAVLGGMGGSYALIVIAKWTVAHVTRLTMLTKLGKYSLIAMCFHDVDLDNFSLPNRVFALLSTAGFSLVGVVAVVALHLVVIALMIIVIPQIPGLRNVYLHRQFGFKITTN